jgi:hypothetical protein
MARNEENKGVSTGTALGVAAAATAAAAAAAGAYWLYGAKDAERNRKKARSFMLKARADVVDAVEKMKDIDKNSYMQLVDRVVSKYAGAAGITAAEVAQMTRDLRAAWTHMQAARTTASGAAKSAKKSVKKAVSKKKTVPKKK